MSLEFDVRIYHNYTLCEDPAQFDPLYYKFNRTELYKIVRVNRVRISQRPLIMGYSIIINNGSRGATFNVSDQTFDHFLCDMNVTRSNELVEKVVSIKVDIHKTPNGIIPGTICRDVITLYSGERYRYIMGGFGSVKPQLIQQHL